MGSKRSALTGRNRFAQKCIFCGVNVPAGVGFLKKRPKGVSGYDVFHEECKPGAVKETKFTSNQMELNVEDDVLTMLETTLMERQLSGAPVVYLPKIIDYIKSLKLKIVELSQ